MTGDDSPDPPYFKHHEPSYPRRSVALQLVEVEEPMPCRRQELLCKAGNNLPSLWLRNL